MQQPEARFVEQVKDALDHLYDLIYLREHPLVATLVPNPLPIGVNRGQALRRILLDAIEQLATETAEAASERPHRLYRILLLRYVEKLPFREVMAELALSQPQFHRDQRRALEVVALLLWERSTPIREQGAESGSDSVTAWTKELAAVTLAPEGSVGLRELVEGVVALIGNMARERNALLRTELPDPDLSVLGNRTILRQILIGAASYALHGARAGGCLVLSYEHRDGIVVLNVCFDGIVDAEELETAHARDHLDEGERLLRMIRASRQIEVRRNHLRVGITLPRKRQHALLVIDDNPDMVRMITRFVTDHGYNVLRAGSVDEGVHIAQTWRPDVIVLDIMLPESDGWDALQLLKHHPSTQDIPVLVCSVLAESELALALGAAGFLRKPLTRPDLLCWLLQLVP